MADAIVTKRGLVLSRKFRRELSTAIRVLIIREHLDWEKIKHYELKIMFKKRPGGMAKYCILCDTTKDATCVGLWTCDNPKLNTVYFLCGDCADELFSLPENQRASIVEKIIEKRIEATPTIRLDFFRAAT